MKFGQQLKEALYEPWRFYYLDYDSLKRQIKFNGQGQHLTEGGEAQFVEQLEKELDKVDSFHKIKSGEISRHVQYLRNVVDSLRESENTPEARYVEAEEEINRIITEVNELATFTRLNYSGFLKIVKKHDKHTSYALKPLFNVSMNARSFYKQNYDRLLVQLSSLYDLVRNRGKKGGQVWTAGGTRDFVRKTTKYWVHPDNVMELKLYILKFLPVLIYNATSDTDIADPAITSIYFDNDSFDLYLGRLQKLEGAEAIRLRWKFFVERKTHQEDWTGEKSVKQRFPLKGKNVNAFLRGEYSIEKTASKMVSRGKSVKEVDAFRQLATEVQSRVLEKNLRPAIRSFYNRTAFQLPGDASVRISLDTELSLIREDNFGMMRAGDNWRRTDIGTDWPFSQLPEGDICRFPYAILEVKLQTQYGSEPPVWVQRLIESHLVEAVPKFSKYIHGIATLLEDKVSLLPFWLPQMVVDIRREPTADWLHYRDQTQPRDAHTDSTSSHIEEGDVETDNIDEPNLSKFQTPGSRAVTGLRGLVRRLNQPSHDEMVEPTKSIALPVRVEPKVFFANERTFLSWLHFGIVLSSLSIGLFNFGDKVGQVAASVFILISMGVFVYAVCLFYWRGNRIRARQKMAPMMIPLDL
ncbi:hypothetical protein L0F63_004786 [Massospora cicadina]|nr:hypothetical protein L0F63_004786 [Massospora cicadina]